MSRGLRGLVTFGRGRALYAEQLRYGHRAGLEAGVAEAAMALGIFALGSPPGVRFAGVTFRYRPDDPDVLRDVTFMIPAGAMVALGGASGLRKRAAFDELDGTAEGRGMA